MPVYETVTTTLADGTVVEEVRVEGEAEEVKDEEVEAEIQTMIKDVEVIEATAQEATELSDKLSKEALVANNTKVWQVIPMNLKIMKPQKKAMTRVLKLFPFLQ
jgi:urease gamma subunit